MTRDEARRIASNIAKLPELLKQPKYEAANETAFAGELYQMYSAASAIKTATATNNTVICTHRLLVSPP